MSGDAEDESDLAAKDRVGKTLAGKWHLDAVLGIGGMAAVYQATHTNNSKRVAIKVLHAQLSASVELKRRFLREGYIANSVGHPGALSVIDDGTDDDGTVFLVMELLEGESLRARANQKGGRIEAGELLPMIDDILDVLITAHKNGIVHRDLKADNIFILNDGSIKVLDFGIARILESEETKTRTGLVLGTPEYMAPEQARGRSELVDGRVDLWAVGAMIFRHLTGRHVHEAETTNEVLLLAMTKSAPKLADVMPNPPESLAILVDKALAFERDDRWANASLMQIATREATNSVRMLERANTLVGQPSPIDIASAKDVENAPKAISVTAMTESSDINEVVRKSAPSRSFARENTALPIVSSVPSRRRGKGLVLAVFGLAAIAAGVLFFRSKLDLADGAATIASDNPTAPPPTSGIPDPTLTGFAGGDAGELVDAGEDLDAEAEDDDASADEDEDEEIDAGRPLVRRPTTGTPHKKTVPTKTKKKKKKR